MRLGRTVDELLESVDSQDITEAHLVYDLMPWGDDRGDLQAAIVASTVHNSQVTKEEHLRTASDFLPEFGRMPDPPLTTEELAEKIANTMAAFGGQQK